MEDDGKDRLLTAGEVARHLGVNPKTITRWAAAGKIRSVRTPSGALRFRESDVRTLLEDRGRGTYALVSEFANDVHSDEVLHSAPIIVTPLSSTDETEGRGNPVSRDHVNATAHFARSLEQVSVSEALPMFFYMLGDGDYSTAEEAISQLLEAYDVHILSDSGPIYGSWLRRIVGRAKDVSGTEVGKQLTAEMTRAAQLRAVDSVQAEVDVKKAEAVAKLMEGIQNVPEAVIQIGALILIKTDDGVVRVRDLTPQEVVHLRQNAYLVEHPRRLIIELEQMSRVNVSGMQAIED